MSRKLPAGWFEKIAKETRPLPFMAPDRVGVHWGRQEVPVHVIKWALGGDGFSPESPATFITYSIVHNVPFSQVHPGSAGGHEGRNHILFQEPFSARWKLIRQKGQLLCGRKVWDYRAPAKEDTEKCPKCIEMAERYVIPWPAETGERMVA